MPRSNWKGYISFGLVSIPIVLFNSIDPQSNVSFKQINKKTGATIKYKRIDTETEKEVPWEDIGKGYRYDKDVILSIEEDELKRVAGVNARTIAIEEFVDKNNINFIEIEHSYFLVPDKNGEKGYVILREALKDSNKVGIAKVILSTKEYLAALSTHEDALVLYLLHYESEMRKLSEFNIPNREFKKYKVSQAEINIAKKLIGAMSTKWKPEKYKDEYKEAVEKWVNEKVHHLPESKMKPRVEKRPPNVVNFIDLLKKSLHSNKRASNQRVMSKVTKPLKQMSKKSPQRRKTAVSH